MLTGRKILLPSLLSLHHLTQDPNGVNNLSTFVSDGDFNYDELTSMELSTIITWHYVTEDKKPYIFRNT